MTMRSVAVLALSGLAAVCGPAQAKSPPTPEDLQLAAAEALIDAFYSFDPAPLRTALSSAPKSAPAILYYQGWAEGGNYKVLDRKTCSFDKPNEVRCPITVKDDLIGALGTGYDVTDVFHIGFEHDRIVSVRNSSNDPPEMKQAFKWLQEQRPQIFSGPCKDMFAGGLTPQDCIRAVVAGFKDFVARPRS